MSLNLTAVALTPSTVYTGSQFIISVMVYDDVFEFAATYGEYDEHQGFGNAAQTIGGMLVELVRTSELRTSDGKPIVDANGNYLIPSDEITYTLDYSGSEIDQFLSEVLDE